MLGFPGKMRKRHAEATESSGKFRVQGLGAPELVTKRMVSWLTQQLAGAGATEPRR